MDCFARLIWKSFLVTLIFLNALLLGRSQTATADVVGRVLDQNEAAVANATVTARNEGTGYQRIAQSNAQGEYSLTQLQPGTYEISVVAPNFGRVIRSNLNLNVGARRTLNWELRPGTITGTVEIAKTAPSIETTNTEIGGVVTPLEVQNLPLINRTFAALSIVIPEARPANNFDPTKTRVGNVSFSGGDGRQTNVNVDGGDNKDNVVGSLIQNFPYESIQEFQVLEHNWSAQSGRAVGGVINVITKSGSNSTHGSLFTNFLDDALRKKSFFETRDARQKPNYDRQETGGSVGGRLIRDKLFFFGAFEAFRERQMIFTPSGVLAQLAMVPGADPRANIPARYNDRLLTLRLDHRLNGSQTLFYRYSQQNNYSQNDIISDPANTDLTGGNTDDNKAHSFVASHNWAMTGSKLNQLLFQYQDYKNEILRASDLPTLTFPGNIQTGSNVNMPQATVEKKFQVREDFSMERGGHAIKVGANYIYSVLGGYYYFSKGYQLTFFDSPTTIKNNSNGKYPQGFATPGAVRSLTFYDGDATHEQNVHQLALYVEDDLRVGRRLTLNLGVRWDANIGELVDQTNNRTVNILRQVNQPLARAIAGDSDALRRRTPGWLEFQPRIGIAYDPTGFGTSVIRAGYGIFYDQIFQNLTFFSLQQTRDNILQSLLLLTNNDVGVGDPFLRNYRFGVDPLPSPQPVASGDLAQGAFGRINDPKMRDPYVQKWSIGFQKLIRNFMSLSTDYVHALGVHEPRVLVINPQILGICNPGFLGATPSSPLCVRESSGGVSRLFDKAFRDAGLGVNRLAQINMIGTTNRSMYDSWTTQLKFVTRQHQFSVAYVLSSSRSWGGQATASYNGNTIAITPEQQFRPEEFGPTRFDERHRLVASGVATLPHGVQISYVFQLASARPYSPTTGLDIDGDGLAVNDRLCSGVDPMEAFRIRGNSTAVLQLNPRGCVQAKVNSIRDGFTVDQNGNVNRVSGRYFNIDLRVSKVFAVGERLKLYGYVDVYNATNSVNLSCAERRAVSPATSQEFFLQPASLYGSGFGQPIGRPLTFQVGFRLAF